MTEMTTHGRLLIGHLYAKASGKLIFSIDCKTCDRVFEHWSTFAEHYRRYHFKANERSKLYKERSKELATFEKPEMVLIADENDSFLRHEKSAGEDVLESEVHQLRDLEIEHIDVNNEQEQNTQAEEYLSSLVIVPLEFDESNESKNEEHEKVIGEHANEDDGENNSSEESELQCTIVSPKQAGSTDTTPKYTRQVYLPRRRDTKQKPEKYQRRFYNLRDTEPKVMLHFIKLIQMYPCHWDVNDEHYGTRLKRHESASFIAKELKKYWHINASTTTVLASITSLLRWYEKEFMRLQEPLAEPTQFIRYYEALARFLVKEHLKNFQCTECQRAFRTHNQLLSHKHLVHNAAAPFKCSHCDRTFAYESLKRHHENRHTLKESFACMKCKYRAPNKTDLQMHMSTHTDVRSFICDECGASYKSSTSLNVHKRTHGAPRFTCGHCGKEFYENYRFKCHLQLHGREDTPLKCKVCEIELPTKLSVKEHMRSKHNVFTKKGSSMSDDWWMMDEFGDEDEENEDEEEFDVEESETKHNNVILVDGSGQIANDDDVDIDSMDFDEDL